MNRIKGLIALLLVTTIIFSGCGTTKNVSKETKVKTESSKDDKVPVEIADARFPIIFTKIKNTA